MQDTLEELLVLERQLEREWWWLHGALTAVAQAQAECAEDNAMRFRGMQAQVREVGRKRVQIATRIAAMTSSMGGAAINGLS